MFKKGLMRKGVYFIVLVISMLLVFLLLRTLLFSVGFKKVHHKLQDRTGWVLSFSEYRFTGIRSLRLQHLLIATSSGDTLVSADSIHVQVKVGALLTGRVRINKLHLKNLTMNLSRSAFEKATQSKTEEMPSDSVESRNYAAQLSIISKTLFSYIPDEIQIDGITISAKSDEGLYRMKSELLVLTSGLYQCLWHVYDPFENSAVWQVSGHLNGKERIITSKIVSPGSLVNSGQMLQWPYGLHTRFDTLQGGFQVIEASKSMFTIEGEFKTKGWEMRQSGLAPENIRIENLQTNIKVLVDEQNLILDSSSMIQLNQIKVFPYAKYTFTLPKQVQVGIRIPDTECSTLVSSLPDGLFETIRDIKATGNIAYNFGLNILPDTPDSLFLFSKLTKNQVRIHSFGKADLYQINDTFTHNVYDNGIFSRTIFVGPENPDFCPLDKISPLLINCVVATEDGGFFYHNGFDMEGIKRAVSDNLKKGKFARGGSTISQQLVKNMYLNQQKNLLRKLEEVMLVWMLENLNITTKERMLEIYLNIIEWGPGVYGIHEAAEFYFDKKPSELTLSESVFLASIIPAPSRFYKSFNQSGEFGNYYQGYFNSLITTMLLRNNITTIDTVNLSPKIVLSGPARKYLTHTDSVSLENESLERYQFE